MRPDVRSTRQGNGFPLNQNRNNNRRRGRGNNRGGQGGGNQGNRIDSRARGNAPQMLEKYRKLAHDASLNGDRVQTEYYLQFADHYFRVIADMRAQKEDQRPRRDEREQSSSYDDTEDFDEFEDWGHRIASHAGLGYALFETERFELIVRGGFGAYRTFGAEDDRWVPEALAGGEGIWRIASGHELSFFSWLYPDLDDTGEFRNLSGAAWKIGLTQELSLKLSVENEYESLVEADTEHNDLRYTGSILIGF